MAREVPEWIGKTDDHRAPGGVRDRIMQRDSRCHICTKPIQAGEKWDLDHVVALINGGENRETNLRPSHRKCHKEKTAQDVAEKAKVAAKRMKHRGIKRETKPIPSPGFQQSEKAAKRVAKQALPPRQLFERSQA